MESFRILKVVHRYICIYILEYFQSSEASANDLGTIDLLKQRRELSKRRKLCLVQTVSLKLNTHTKF